MKTAGGGLDSTGLRKKIPARLLAELRTDHAGETGAVMIYRGVLSVSGDQAVLSFARHHLDTESRHLAIMEGLVPGCWQSRLLPIWRLAGWLTGAVPSLFGPTAVYATVQAVETFVDRHYRAQLEMIDALEKPPGRKRSSTAYHPESDPALTEIRQLLDVCRKDELMHRDEAASLWPGKPGFLLRIWLHCVNFGSAWAVQVSRKI